MILMNNDPNQIQVGGLVDSFVETSNIGKRHQDVSTLQLKLPTFHAERARVARQFTKSSVVLERPANSRAMLCKTKLLRD